MVTLWQTISEPGPSLNFPVADNSEMERNGYRRLRPHQRPRTFHQAKPKIVQIRILAIDAIRPSFHQVRIRT